MLKENQFLVCGSGAGEGIPSAFCNCRICRYAREHGGKDWRTRAGYQLGNAIRFDWGPDAPMQAAKFNLDYSKIQHMFFTHSHSDHLYQFDFWTRLPNVSEVVPYDLDIYGNEEVCRLIEKEVGMPDKCRMNLVRLTAFQPVRANQSVVTPLPAAHMDTEQAFLLLVEICGKRLLIGHDSQNYPDETMEFLKGKYLDYIFPDATWTLKSMQYGHMGIPDDIAVYQRLAATEAADQNTKVFPTHISPNHGALHREIEEFLKPYPNFSPAYDGLLIEL